MRRKTTAIDERDLLSKVPQVTLAFWIVMNLGRISSSLVLLLGMILIVWYTHRRAGPTAA